MICNKMLLSWLDNPPLPAILVNFSFLAFILIYTGTQKSISSCSGNMSLSLTEDLFETTECNNSILLPAIKNTITGLCSFAIPEWLVHYFFLHGLKLRLAGWNFHMEHHKFPENLPKVPHSIGQHYLWTVSLLILYSVCSDGPSRYFFVAGSILGLLLHEIAHLHAHGHPFLIRYLRFLEPCRRYHSYHHYSCEGQKIAFGLITPWMDFISGHLPPDPSASPFHVQSKQFNSSFSCRVVHTVMRLPLPLPYVHWACMYYLSQEGDF